MRLDRVWPAFEGRHHVTKVSHDRGRRDAWLDRVSKRRCTRACLARTSSTALLAASSSAWIDAETDLLLTDDPRRPPNLTGAVTELLKRSHCSSSEFIRSVQHSSAELGGALVRDCQQRSEQPARDGNNDDRPCGSHETGSTRSNRRTSTPGYNFVTI